MAALAAFDAFGVLQRVVRLAGDAGELHYGVGRCAFQSVQGDAPGGACHRDENVSEMPGSGGKRLGDHGGGPFHGGPTVKAQTDSEVSAGGGTDVDRARRRPGVLGLERWLVCVTGTGGRPRVVLVVAGGGGGPGVVGAGDWAGRNSIPGYILARLYVWP